ncbi:helix-turn-helix transcriptional regulator [Levilactobacillus spicheri]|uniref:Alkaline phosphatase n=1 Tax=Levilactobacillus spicheri TaxID=216463 RepID=A0A0F3RU13_9LACO|nr:WYL domain-containing protein [Levilactobacillus spicheri]KJW13380.1 alkaline phosphatase [Levilactobacillus spicheri]
MTKFERLNQELIFLSYKTGFHVQDLMDEFHISKRTALRDITALEGLGLTFYTEPGRYGGYRLTKQDQWVPVLFNGQEINALFFAIKALSLLSATPFEKSYRAIYDKLMATLPVPQQRTVRQLQAVVHYYNVPNLDTPTFLSDLLTAIVDQQVVTVTLPSGPHKQQLFDLLYRHGIWFFSGYDLDRHAWGITRCDAVSALSVSAEPAVYDRATLDRFRRDYDAHHHDVPFRCTLTPLGRELVQKNRYPNMHLHTEHGQTILAGGYNADEFAYMVQYLLGLGNNVHVLAPPALQAAYLQELREILARYEPPAAPSDA